MEIPNPVLGIVDFIFYGKMELTSTDWFSFWIV
jgi:hypothetical protein